MLAHLLPDAVPLGRTGHSQLEKLLKADPGVDFEEAKKRGLLPKEYSPAGHALSLKSYTYRLSIQNLEVELPRRGPLWCTGRWDGFVHAVLIVGVDKSKDRIYFIDPLRVWGGEFETDSSMANFNTGRAGYDGIEWSVQQY